MFKSRVDPQRFSEVLYGFRSVSALQISLGQTVVRPGRGGVPLHVRQEKLNGVGVSVQVQQLKTEIIDRRFFESDRGAVNLFEMRVNLFERPNSLCRRKATGRASSIRCSSAFGSHRLWTITPRILETLVMSASGSASSSTRSARPPRVIAPKTPPPSGCTNQLLAFRVAVCSASSGVRPAYTKLANSFRTENPGTVPTSMASVPRIIGTRARCRTETILSSKLKFPWFTSAFSPPRFFGQEV